MLELSRCCFTESNLSVVSVKSRVRNCVRVAKERKIEREIGAGVDQDEQEDCSEACSKF